MAFLGFGGEKTAVWQRRERALDDQRASVVRAMRVAAAGKKQADLAGTRVGVTGVTCESGHCVAKLHVENLGATPLVFNKGFDFDHESRVTLQTVGEASWPMHADTTADGTTIEAHGARDVDVAIPAQGELVTVCSRTSCVALDVDSVSKFD